MGERYFAVRHGYDPLNATMLGLSEFDARLPEVTRSADEQAVAGFDAVLHGLDAIDPAELDRADQVDHAVLGALTRGARDEAADAQWAYNVSDKGYVSPQGLLFQAMPAMVADESTRAQAYLSRLAGVPGMLAALAERYRAEQADGRTATVAGVRHAIAQLEGYLARGVDDDPLLRPARGQVVFDQARELIIDRVRPAYARLADVLRDELLAPHGAARDDDHVGIMHVAGGEQTYARALARHTTVPADQLSPDQVHEIGLDTIAELDDQWRRVGRAALGTDDFGEIVGRLRSDPALRFETSAQIVAVAEAATRRAEAARSEYFPDWPIGTCVVEEVDPVEAEHGSMAYYRPPADDGSRPGAHCLLTTDPTQRFRFEYESLAFHESVPGHHLQLASTQLLDIPRYRRHLDVEACAFNEGWGLYSEALADELGLYSGPLDQLGRLSFASLRACRLVVDTGMHALGWTRRQAIDFMTEHTATTQANIHNEIDRYITWPGQACAYRIGQREITRLREQAKQRLGGRFSLPEYHRTVIEHGAVPLSVLAGNVRHWVEQIEEEHA